MNLKLAFLFFLVFFTVGNSKGQDPLPRDYIDSIAIQLENSVDYDDLDRVFEDLFDTKSLEGMIANLTLLFHNIFVEDDSQILNDFERRTLKKLRPVVKPDSLDVLTSVKVNKEKGIITFNSLFLIKLFNYIYLQTYSEFPDLNRENLYDLYGKVLHKFEEIEIGSDIAHFGEKQSEFSVLRADLKSLFVLIFNLAFIEFHEIYHVCYDENRVDLKSEFKADSFAINKIHKLINYDKFFGTMASGLDNESELSLDEEITIILSVMTTFDFIRDRFSPKLHIFRTSLENIFERRKKIFEELVNIYCVLDDRAEIEICDSLFAIKRELDFVDYAIDPSNLSKMNSIDEISHQGIDLANQNSVFLKLNFLIYDNEFEKAFDLVQLIVNSKEEYDEVLLEYCYILGSYLATDLGRDYYEVIEYLEKARSISILLAEDYYNNKMHTLKKENSFTIIDSFNERDSVVRVKYHKEIDQGFDFETVKFHIRYTIDFGIVDTEISGRWSGNVKDGKGNGRLPDGPGMFISFDGENMICYDGNLSLGRPHGIGEFYLKINTTEGLKERIFSSFFDNGRASGLSYMRLIDQETSLIFDLDNEKLISDVSLWMSEGDMTIAKCPKSNFFLNEWKNCDNLNEEIVEIYSKNIGYLNRVTLRRHKSLLNPNKFQTCCIDDKLFLLYTRQDFVDLCEQVINEFYDSNDTNKLRYLKEKYILDSNIHDNNSVFKFGLNIFIDCLTSE